MQVSIVNGIFSDEAGDYRTSYPINLIPVPKENGVSEGYLRPADGIELRGVGPGIDRGGINWNGVLYRVMGNSLVSIGVDNTFKVLGTIGGIGQVTMDYSFDYLIIAGGGSLYYWSGTTLKQVIDVDLGEVIDVLWVDGYTMTTDGTSLIVTDLNDPTSVNPLAYGSSEIDPDPVKGLFKLHNEVYALNRYTIEVFNNRGLAVVGNQFPFERNQGASISRGVVGTYAAATYTVGETEVIAFLGSGRNEAPSIWVGVNASSTKIATREIDTLIQRYTEDELSTVVMESRLNKGHYHLYVHLPDVTMVYDAKASEVLQKPVWFLLTSSIGGMSKYRARNLVWCYNDWHVADPTTANYGRYTDETGEHYGQTVGWQFGTSILYNASMGALINLMELVCLPGRVKLGANPVVWTSYSEDGETWSQERTCNAGKIGDRRARLTWPRNGRMSNIRIQRFRGTSDAHLSFPRLEVQVEALNA
jgi:hypothetical protein